MDQVVHVAGASNPVPPSHPVYLAPAAHMTAIAPAARAAAHLASHGTGIVVHASA